MPYPEMFIAPMRGELTEIGARELRTAEAVDDQLGATRHRAARRQLGLRLRRRQGTSRSGDGAAPSDQARRSRHRVRGRRHRRYRAGARAHGALPAVVTIDRTVQGWKAGVDDGAARDRRPRCAGDLGAPDARLRSALQPGGQILNRAVPPEPREIFRDSAPQHRVRSGNVRGCDASDVWTHESRSDPSAARSFFLENWRSDGRMHESGSDPTRPAAALVLFGIFQVGVALEPFFVELEQTA